MMTWGSGESRTYCPTPAFTLNTTQTVGTLKFGVNYRLGGASGPLSSWY